MDKIHSVNSHAAGSTRVSRDDQSFFSFVMMKMLTKEILQRHSLGSTIFTMNNFNIKSMNQTRRFFQIFIVKEAKGFVIHRLQTL